MSCTEKCWTPVRCKAHGLEMTPWGRSVPFGYGHDCAEPQPRENTMHLFDEHDSDRIYFDRPGWVAHEASCDQCNPNHEEES